MIVVKPDGKVGTKLRALEDYMRENNIEIVQRHDGLQLEIDGHEIVVTDESGECLQEFPPLCEPTVVRPIKNFLNGT